MSGLRSLRLFLVLHPLGQKKLKKTPSLGMRRSRTTQKGQGLLVLSLERLIYILHSFHLFMFILIMLEDYELSLPSPFDSCSVNVIKIV